MNTFATQAGVRAVVLAAACLIPAAVLNAQSLGAVFSADETRIRLAQESQERVDAVVDETRSLSEQYSSVTKEIDGLLVYNTLLDRQIANQNLELASLNTSIDQVTVIERQIMPMMLDMIDGLEQFVGLDVPFLADERKARLERLNGLMERSDVSVAEKFRRVLEAFQVENDYGRTIEAYKGIQQVGGDDRQVDILRIGRVALLYQTEDSELAGAWDQASRSWLELDSSYRNQIRQGIRMAYKQVAPDLLLLPIASPEDAQ